eukprot:1035482-Alexandrium_andersonii.AAC.1
MTLRSTMVPPVRIRTRIGQADRGAEAATGAAAAAAPTAMPSSARTRPLPAVSAASPGRSMPTG